MDKMFPKFVFTSLLVASLYLLCEGSIGLNQTKAFLAIQSELGDIKSEQALIKADQQLFKADLELIKTGQSRLESKLDVLIEKLKLITETKYWRSCAEATSTFKNSGTYNIIIPSYSNKSFKVDCDADTHEGNWTIILRRMDGSVNFYRKWADYKAGFGNLSGEFFLGLDKIHAITNDQPQELLVLLEDFEDEVRYEAYDEFAIGNELDLYKLHTLGNATGTAGDSLSKHRGMSFTSQDRDNDISSSANCAVTFTGGWWFSDCHTSNLMGKYNDNNFSKGVSWVTWRGLYYSLKRAVMLIRPKKI